MASLTRRQAQISRRKRIRGLETRRDQAMERMDKAKADLKRARTELANARKEG